MVGRLVNCFTLEKNSALFTCLLCLREPSWSHPTQSSLYPSLSFQTQSHLSWEKFGPKDILVALSHSLFWFLRYSNFPTSLLGCFPDSKAEHAARQWSLTLRVTEPCENTWCMQQTKMLLEPLLGEASGDREKGEGLGCLCSPGPLAAKRKG